MAAVFQPLRRRTQAVMDRRCKTIETFNAHLRDQIDLDTLSAELVAVVDQTMDRPRVSLWLQRPDRQALSTLRPDTHDLNRPSSQRDWPPTSIGLDQDYRRPAVKGKGRAFGACCFAGKLRNPTHPPGDPAHPAQLRGLDPYANPYAGHPRTLTASSSVFTLLMPPRGASRCITPAD
jgi:hypothetical protein